MVQVASGRFGVHEKYLNAGAAVEIKMGQGAKPGIGGHLPGAKIVGDISRTRMIPESRMRVGAAPVPPRKPSMAMISAPLLAMPLAMAAILCTAATFTITGF